MNAYKAYYRVQKRIEQLKKGMNEENDYVLDKLIAELQWVLEVLEGKGNESIN